MQFGKKNNTPFSSFWGSRYWNWIISVILDLQYLKFGLVVALWIFFRMPWVWPNLDSSRQIYAQCPTMTLLWVGSVEWTCTNFHVSFFSPLDLKLIERKQKSVYFHPLLTKFKSDAQRESYDDFPTVTCLRWNSGAWKNPNFHRSYIRKCCEPRSKIFTRSSSGFQLLVVNI